MRLGVIVDIHGKSVVSALEEFTSQKVEVVLVNGDFSDYNNSIKVLTEFIDFNKDVLVIPGSHESKNEYEQVMNELSKYEHIIDMANLGMYDLGDLVILPYPGSRIITGGIMFDSFYISTIEQSLKLIQKIRKTNKPVIIQSHDPPKGYCDIAYFFKHPLAGIIPAKEAIAYFGTKIIPYCRKEHVGDEFLLPLIEGEYAKKPVVTTCGHIHENHKFTSPGVEVPTRKEVHEKEFVEHLVFNASAYVEGRIGLVEILDGKVCYRIKKL